MEFSEKDQQLGKPTLKRIRYTQDAMIDQILLEPSISQNDLGKIFGFTPTWVSIIVNSDAFKERLAERKGELTDPILKATLDEKVMGVAHKSMDLLIQRLENPNSAIHKTADLIAMAKLVIGPPQPTAPAPTTNLYVVQVPGPARNSQEWLDNRSDRPRLQNSVQILEEVRREA